MSVRDSGRVSIEMHGRKSAIGQHAKTSSLDLPAFITEQTDGVLIAIKLQPRASKNKIDAPLGEELRIKVTAPPVDSAANEALVRLLAEALGCPRSNVELVRGHSSRHKIIRIRGLSAHTVFNRLV